VALKAVAVPGSLESVLDFMRAMWAVQHEVELASRRMERTLGVTVPQRLVVRLVAREPGISAGAVALALHVHPSTLTGVLARLLRKRIITRTADPVDARRVQLRLTAEGEAVAAERAGTIEEQFRRALGRATAGDLAATHRVMRLLTESLARGA